MQDYIQELLDIQDIDAKYEYLIHIGKLEPKLNLKSKTTQNLIKNCQNKVWIELNWEVDSKNPKEKNLQIRFESESRLVAGMIFLVKCKLHGKTQNQLQIILKPESVTEWKSELFGNNIISMTRQNGLMSVIDKIRKFVES